ncbi:hypothetical protein ACIGO6_39770 [Streptomyces sp. NPDC053750]|uniref:hypothetical protein n=1 Tax=Streptomyces sp. NPDC053750 TaxID=3365714 RepID=UPI0037D090A8
MAASSFAPSRASSWASSPGGPGRARRDRAVAIVLAELRQAGGYRRGMAAQLAREHGGSERGWQRAMNEACAQYEHGQDQDDAGTVPQAAQPSP